MSKGVPTGKALARRLDRAIERGHTTQPRHGQCVLCHDNWDTCPCTRQEVDGLLAARQIQKTMERFA